MSPEQKQCTQQPESESLTPNGEAAPLVSVIMAAYNCEKYIGEAIESVIAQTYPHWELLCIDDCSTDGTRAIISGYADADDRIRLLPNEQNMGAAATRNRGIEAARGEFIAILDSDDVSMPDRLERSLAMFRKHPEVVLVGSGARLIDGESKDRGPWYKHQMVHSSVMIPREALEEIGGYDEFFRYGHDVDMLLRLSLHGPFYIAPRPMVSYRRHGSGISVDQTTRQGAYGTVAIERFRAMLRGHQMDVKKRFQELLDSMELTAGVSYERGRGELLCGNAGEARSHLVEAVRMRPGRFTPWIWLLFSILPAPLRSVGIRGWYGIKWYGRQKSGLLQWGSRHRP